MARMRNLKKVYSFPSVDLQIQTAMFRRRVCWLPHSSCGTLFHPLVSEDACKMQAATRSNGKMGAVLHSRPYFQAKAAKGTHDVL